MITRGDPMMLQKQTHKTHKIIHVDQKICRPEPTGPLKLRLVFTYVVYCRVKGQYALFSG